MDKNKTAEVIEILNKIMEYELSGVVRYTHYALMITGRDRLSLAQFFKDQASESLLHAQEAGCLAEVPPESREQVELELAAEHEVISGGIKRAVEMGVVDEVVEPVATKRAVAQILWDTPGVRGVHGNIPL